MNALTQSIAIRGVDLSDRLVMPPMASGKPNPDGTVSDSLVEYYKEKSQGGYLGLVITEHAFVCQQGKAHGGQLSIAREEDIPAILAHRAKKPNAFPFGNFVKIYEKDMEAILRLAAGKPAC